MIKLVALTFPDDRPSLEFALRVLRELSAADLPELDVDSFLPPPLRRTLRPPPFTRDSRRFRFTDDPEEASN